MAEIVPASGNGLSVTAAPGGLLLAHGLTCPQCHYPHCALWGFAPLGQVPPNGICPSCGHKFELAHDVHDALVAAAAVPRLAVLLDADNFDAAELAPLRQWFEQRGELAIFRGYGNQKTFAGPAWEESLLVGLDLVVTQVRPQAADMAIAVDLGVLASCRQYHEIHVVSGDRALLLAAEHVAARFGERQQVYWGLPYPLMHHTEQCRIGVRHARKEELLGLLQMLIFEHGGRVRSDVLHRDLLATVPWFAAPLYGSESFPQFVAETFMVERNGQSYWVSLPEPEEWLMPPLIPPEDAAATAHHTGQHKDHKETHDHRAHKPHKPHKPGGHGGGGRQARSPGSPPHGGNGARDAYHSARRHHGKTWG